MKTRSPHDVLAIIDDVQRIVQERRQQRLTTRDPLTPPDLTTPTATIRDYDPIDGDGRGVRVRQTQQHDGGNRWTWTNETDPPLPQPERTSPPSSHCTASASTPPPSATCTNLRSTPAATWPTPRATSSTHRCTVRQRYLTCGDPHCAQLHGQKPSNLLVTSGRLHLWILPSDKSTANTADALSAYHHGAIPMDLIANALRPLAQHVVVIDTAPSASALQACAIYAADLCLIPAACDTLAQYGVADTTTTIEIIATHKRILTAIIPTFYDAKTTESARILNDYQTTLAEHYPVLSPISRATAIRQASAHGQTIYEYAPSSPIAGQLARMADEIADLL